MTMSHEEFNEVFDRVVDRARHVLVTKAAEYATEDRLHNFRKAASLQDCNERMAVAGMAVKHFVSVYDLVREEELADQGVWDEKIGDALNYLILLEAVIQDERNQRNDKVEYAFINQSTQTEG